MSGYRSFFDATNRQNDGRYDGARAQATLIVTRVETDSSGAVLAAHGTLQGEGAGVEFYMPLRGASAGVGDHLLGTYPANNPTGGELTYVRHVYSDALAAGLLIPDADLPAPAFGPVPFGGALDASAGNISAYVVVYFLAVEERYQPSGYTISYRAVGSQWTDQSVPHLGGTQQARLAVNFPPGTYVDVRMRARYNWAQSESLPGETLTVRAAVDDISPGNATGLGVQSNAPGGLNIFASGALDSAHFDHWQYEIAMSPAGTGLDFRAGGSPYFYTGTPGAYYVAAAPVSKTGVVGGRYPGTGWLGPFTLLGQTQLDTTPPPDWTLAPLLTITREVSDISGERAKLTVALPSYPYPDDYDTTIVTFVTNNVDYGTMHIANGLASAFAYVPFGTTVASLRGRDKAQNLSNNPSPNASIFLGGAGTPQDAPTLTVAPFALALLLKWTPIANALAYEVQRAPHDAAINGPGPYATIATLDARVYVDTLNSETLVLPQYWYRVRALNNAGAGAYSAQQYGRVAAMDGQNIRLNSITVQQMAADSIAANNIQAGAIVAGKIAADLVITSILRTGGGATQIAIVGDVPGNQYNNSMVFVDNTIVRARFNGTGLELYRDDGSPIARFDGTGITMRQANGGIRAFYDASGLYIYGMNGSLEIRDDLTVPGVGIHNNFTDIVPDRQVSRLYMGSGTPGYHIYRLGPAPDNQVYFERYDSSTLALSSSGFNRFVLRGLDLGFAPGGGAIDVGMKRSSAGVLDTIGAHRVGDGFNNVGKLSHTGGGGNLHLDWSTGAGFIGWYANPAQQVIVGNGAQGYGPIAASAFQVNSTAQDKQNIADPSGMWAKLAQLRPRAYQLKSDPTVTRYGFVAEEVRAIMPNLVTQLPAAPYAGPVAPGLLPQPTPAIDVYGLVTLVAAGLVEAAKGASATIAALAARATAQDKAIAALTARLDALAPKP